MRIVLAALLVLSAAPALSASIEGDTAMACRDLGVHRRLATIAGAGDKVAVVAYVREVLKDGRCRLPAEGERVRVEANSWPFACVAPIGSTEPCAWVRQRHVNVRD